MLKSIGECCSGIEAIEFMERLADIIPEDERTNEFCTEYQHSLNRFRYEVSKGIGEKIHVIKAKYRGRSDFCSCGKCGSGITDIWYEYCPNCGTRIIR